MLKVAITGGIGSGKTLVCHVFELLGVPVYYADKEAKRLLQSDPSVRSAVLDAFGKDIQDDLGKLDKSKLAALVFGNDEALKTLEGIIHPAVGRDYLKWVDMHRNHSYTLKEAAILFESGAYKQSDCIILVTAPEEIRISRVAQRDRQGREAILARMMHQWSDSRKMALAQFSIENDGGKLILPQVLDIHRKLLVIATQTDN